MEKILNLLEENAHYTNAEIAVMLGKTEKEVEDQISQLEKDGIICAYKAILNRDKLNDNYVSAVIELKVSPKRDLGFDEIAEKIAEYVEVEDVYLMSGGYDLMLTVSGRTFKDIALFVSQRLSTLDSVLSTATHFILTRYKEKGVLLTKVQTDDRSVTWL